MQIKLQIILARPFVYISTIEAKSADTEFVISGLNSDHRQVVSRRKSSGIKPTLMTCRCPVGRSIKAELL